MTATTPKATTLMMRGCGLPWNFLQQPGRRSITATLWIVTAHGECLLGWVAGVYKCVLSTTKHSRHMLALNAL